MPFLLCGSELDDRVDVVVVLNWLHQIGHLIDDRNDSLSLLSPWHDVFADFHWKWNRGCANRHSFTKGSSLTFFCAVVVISQPVVPECVTFLSTPRFTSIATAVGATLVLKMIRPKLKRVKKAMNRVNHERTDGQGPLHNLSRHWIWTVREPSKRKAWRGATRVLLSFRVTRPGINFPATASVGHLRFELIIKSQSSNQLFISVLTHPWWATSLGSLAWLPMAD